MVMGDLKTPEKLRNKVLFGDDMEENFHSPYTYAYSQFRLLIFGAYQDNKLIGAIYLTPYTFDRLYIDQLFVDPEYQNNPELHVGSSLLKFVENNMDDINDYYRTVFNYLLICPADKHVENIYINNGYTLVNTEQGLMSKKVNKL